MAEAEDDGLLGIEVDSDNYIEAAAAAAGDRPRVPRTFQSRADFEAQKASYTAQMDAGNIYGELIQTVPVLGARADGSAETAPVTLSKKDLRLLGYAVGEMYFHRQYHDIMGLCRRVEARCVVDARLQESLARWVARCRERLTREHGEENLRRVESC